MTAALVAHAEQQFSLSRRDKDGVTRRQHFEAIAQATHETPPELIALPIPVGGIAVWSLFLELNAHRGCDSIGPTPIGLADLVAWQKLMGVTLTPWEIETVLQLDSAALAAQSDRESST